MAEQNADGTVTVLDRAADSNWTKPAKFCGGGGLISTIDNYLSFARLLLTGISGEGKPLLSPALLAMRRNALTADQRARVREALLRGPRVQTGIGSSRRRNGSA
jgi:hypothetical protein